MCWYVHDDWGVLEAFARQYARWVARCRTALELDSWICLIWETSGGFQSVSLCKMTDKRLSCPECLSCPHFGWLVGWLIGRLIATFTYVCGLYFNAFQTFSDNWASNIQLIVFPHSNFRSGYVKGGNNRALPRRKCANGSGQSLTVWRICWIWSKLREAHHKKQNLKNKCNVDLDSRHGRNVQ